MAILTARYRDIPWEEARKCQPTGIQDNRRGAVESNTRQDDSRHHAAGRKAESAHCL